MSILIFIVILFVLVVVHEYGHYKAAKFFGARVDEFGFGYPPKIATLFKRGETVFTLNLLPFGGFVKIYGEDDKGEVSSEENQKRALFKKPKWQQAVVLASGVFMNIFLAAVLLSFGFMIGLPQSIGGLASKDVSGQKLVVMQVEPNSPAELGGLQAKDVITKIRYNGTDQENLNPDSFKETIQKTEGKPFDIIIKRNTENITKTITPVKDTTSGSYRVGVGLDLIGTVKLSFFKAIVSGFKITFILLGDIFVSLFELIKGLFVPGTHSGAQVTGPVGIVKTVGQAASYGFTYILSLTALISLNLAAINILPIPALDGGRLFFLLIEKIKGSRIKPKIANTLNAVFFFGLVGLMLLVTVFDVLKLFK